MGFTTYSKPFTFENVLYTSAKAYSPSASKQAADMSVSNMNFVGIIDSAEITESDLLRGLYDNAEVEFFLVNYQSLGDGKMYFGPGRGNIGEVVIGRNMYEAEFRGLEHFLRQKIGSLYSPSCRAKFGDDVTTGINQCKVRYVPPLWRASTAYTVRSDKDAGVGSVVQPSTANDRQFKCSVAGTSGVSEPSWNTTIGATTTDGTVTWVAIEALTKTKTIAAIASGEERFKFSIDLAESESFYRFGVMTFIDGDNRGMKAEIKDDLFTDYPITGVDTGTETFTIAGDWTAYFTANDVFSVSGSTGNDGNWTVVSATENGGNTDIVVAEDIIDATVDGTISWRPKVVELLDQTPFDNVAGNTVELRAGCDKDLTSCKEKFGGPKKSASSCSAMKPVVARSKTRLRLGWPRNDGLASRFLDPLSVWPAGDRNRPAIRSRAPMIH